ncbi:MAG: MATE family efflux transporter [Clostridiales bacterium]|nr:MATE family efflux transporter [Clostridiales bacterium]
MEYERKNQSQAVSSGYDRFDRTPISALVWKLGVPAMLAQFFNILYSIVDRAFVGHISGSGELALASIGVCAPILTAMTAFSSLIGIGGASAMSISVGERNNRNAEQALNNSAALLLAFSILLTLTALLIEKPLLFLLGCSEAMYPYARAYFRLYVLGTPAVLCGSGLNQFVLAWGNARRGMCAVMIGALVNTLLDPIFIYVFHLDIRGAAIATVIAQYCVLIYVGSFLLSDQALFRIRPERLNRQIVARIFGIGGLPFFIMLFDNLLVISLNAALRRYGGEILGDRYLSCATVVQSFMVLAFYPAQGITTGCGTLYSYHFGAGHYDKVMQVFQCVFLFCAGYMLLLTVLSQLIPEFFAGIFISDRETIRLAADCIRKYTLGLLGVAVQYAIVDGLTAMGQTRLALPISFFRKILYIVCVFLLPLFFSLESVFYSESISDIAGATVTVTVFFTAIRPKLRRKLDQKPAL